MIVTTFETERPVTFVCNNLHIKGTSRKLDLLEAIKSGLLELVEIDKDKDSIIALAPTTTQHLGQLNIPPKPSPEHSQMKVGIKDDTKDTIWKEVLQPEHSYTIRFSKNDDEVFAYYTDGYYGHSTDFPQNQRLTVGREESSVSFTVYNDPAPPRIFARLEMPQLGHLTGPIPFTFVIEYTTDSEETLTIDKSRSPLSVFDGDLHSLEQLIDCRNAETGEEVRWTAFFGCYDFDPHPNFAHDNDFVEISEDKPWRFECMLQNSEGKGSTVRDMWGLDAGKRYTAKIAGGALGGVGRWQYRRKEDLLGGSNGDRKRQWEIEEYKQGM